MPGEWFLELDLMCHHMKGTSHKTSHWKDIIYCSYLIALGGKDAPESMMRNQKIQDEVISLVSEIRK